MNARVLVLEDDVGLATLIARKLEREGAVVEVFSDPEPALKRMCVKPPIELVVVDYRLSATFTGVDFLRSATDGGWTGRAVLVTGFLDENVVLQALRAGIDDVFPKTLDFVDHLVTAVQRLVTLTRQEGELDLLRREKELLVRLNESYASANVIAWNWIQSNPDIIEMSGANLVGLHEQNDGTIALSELRSKVTPVAWRRLVAGLARARRGGDSFELDWVIKAGGKTLLLLLRGRWRSTGIVSGVAVDVTDRAEMEAQVRQALSESKRLNERLRFSISETHHRVKNSLQLVSSLLGMEFRRLDPNLKDVSKRILTQIRALALLHDRLTEVMRDGRDKSVITLPDFVRDIAHLVAGTHLSVAHTSVSISASPRQASTLGVIVTEIISRLPPNSSISIDWHAVQSELRLRLSLRLSDQVGASNDAAYFAQLFEENPVVKSLMKAEFRSQMVIESAGKYELIVDLPMVGLDVTEDVLGAFQ